MNKILQFLKVNIFPILIVLICGILAVQNYVPNTILSGWDTLHPEFDFWIYFKRSLNGVWVEHQGLGAVASQSHSAEIPKLIIWGILSLFLSTNLVRYSFFFLCLCLGALGVYYLSRYILSIKWQKYVNISSFLSSLFYIFNLTTVQQFYVPLEMFAVHYALVPWSFLLGLKYIRELNKKTLLLFALVSFFSSSMSHTATLFYAYLLCFGLFAIFLNFKRGVLLVLLTLIVNSFWILPNIYYIKNHSNEVSISKIHSNFTDEAFMQSQSFGDLNNLSLSKNFLFNWREYNLDKGEFVDLLDEWKMHLDKPYVREIGYGLFIISIFGFLISLFYKPRISFALFLPFGLSVFFWINENPPFTDIFLYIKENFPLIKEGLRFPFTKFSMIYILILSMWFGFGSRFLICLLNKVKLGFVFVFLIISSLIYFQLPQFQGYLISPSMKVVIPNDYFEMFKWLKEQDENSRIAKLPLNTYWGWVYNDWGYQGAGFEWFGIKQPLLNREFDRWSLNNETFFNEASFALNNGDKNSFKKMLEKYNVRYLLLDESITNPGGDKELLKIPETKNLIDELGFNQVFNSGFLTIYDTNIVNDGVVSINSYVPINANLNYSKVDSIYQKYGNYVVDKKGLGLPFVNFDNRGDVSFKISDSTDVLSEELIVENKNSNVVARFPVNEKVSESFALEHGFKEAYNCDLMKSGSVAKFNLEQGRRYLAENGGVSCDYFVFDSLKNSQGYVLRIKGQNLAGRSLKLYLYNWESKRVELEELLPTNEFDSYFVIYPKNNEGQRYTLNVETRSFGRIASENVVESIEFVPIDINFIQNLYTESDYENLNQTGNIEILDIKKWGTAIYKIRTEGRGLFQLNQGYEKGWVTYPKLEHVKVNSWSNGWIINSEEPKEIYVIFWPQFLEWGGFVLLFLTFIYLIVKSK